MIYPTSYAYHDTHPTESGSTPASYESFTFIDGLGRAVQSQEKHENGSSYVVTATQFDAMGRLWTQWRPYTYATGGSYESGFATNAVTAYGSGSRLFVETTYKADALGRIASVIPESPTTSSLPAVFTNYKVANAIIAPFSTKAYSYVETTDEVGHRTDTFYDTFGKQVRAVAGAGTAVAATTDFKFDAAGRMTDAKDPENRVTTYAFDTRGQLSQKSSPDAGTVRFKYDRASNMRFSQDANQLAASKVLFTGYDAHDRPKETGEATLGGTSFASLDPNTTQSFETNGNWISANHYGDDTSGAKPSTSSTPWNTFATEISAASISNPKGQLTANAFKNDGKWQLTLCSYDAAARPSTKYIHTENSARSGVNTAIITRIDYGYNW